MSRNDPSAGPPEHPSKDDARSLEGGGGVVAGRASSDLSSCSPGGGGAPSSEPPNIVIPPPPARTGFPAFPFNPFATGYHGFHPSMMPQFMPRFHQPAPYPQEQGYDGLNGPNGYYNQFQHMQMPYAYNPYMYMNPMTMPDPRSTVASAVHPNVMEQASMPAEGQLHPGYTETKVEMDLRPDGQSTGSDGTTKVESKRKMHVCNFPNCRYQSYRASNMKAHIRHHNRDRPYACSFPGCKYTASQLSNLKVHEGIHTGVRPYICDVEDCIYRATQKSVLSSHKRRMHGISPGEDYEDRKRKITEPPVDMASMCRASSVETEEVSNDDADALLSLNHQGEERGDVYPE